MKKSTKITSKKVTKKSATKVATSKTPKTSPKTTAKADTKQPSKPDEKTIIEQTKELLRPTRSQAITRAGYLFIGVNFFLGYFNIIVGILSGSIAISSDAIHSFIDSITGFLIIISEKLAGHHKLSAHRAKIERITTVIIAIIIILAGADILKEAIGSLIQPDKPDFSIPVIIVLVASIALKFTLASYLKSAGKKQKSTVLAASGAETMNDTWISVAVLASAIFYLISGINIEGYVSLLIALIVIKVGLEFIFPHLTHHHHHHLETDPDHDHCGKTKAKTK